MPRNSRQVQRGGRPVVYGRPPVAPRGRRRPQVTLNLRSLISIAVAVAIIWGWWHFFSVKTIVVSGDRNYAASLVQTAAKQQLHDHWWWRNLMLIDTSKLQKALLASQPQLTDVNIRRRWPGQLRLEVTERQPNLEWKTGDKTYILASDGVVADKAEDTGLRLPVVVDTTNLPVKVGDQVVSSHFVSFCLELISLLPKQGIQVKRLSVPATTTEVDVETNQGYFIKFDTTRSATSEVGDLVRVLNLLKGQNQHPSQYIDLRIDGRAYYK